MTKVKINTLELTQLYGPCVPLCRHRHTLSRERKKPSLLALGSQMDTRYTHIQMSAPNQSLLTCLSSLAYMIAFSL